MKLLLSILVTVALPTTVKAQNLDTKPLSDEAGILYPLQDKSWLAPLNDSTVLEYSKWQNKKPGIYRLPQDNMPCIVPDPTATVAIPNAWKGGVRVPFKTKPPAIPNPGKPIITQPDSK